MPRTNWSVQTCPDYDTLAFKYGEKRLRQKAIVQETRQLDAGPERLALAVEFSTLEDECSAIEAECRKPERQG